MVPMKCNGMSSEHLQWQTMDNMNILCFFDDRADFRKSCLFNDVVCLTNGTSQKAALFMMVRSLLRQRRTW